MNEEQWLACTTRPDMMWASVRGRVSDRKLRLFACAGARLFWIHLTDERSREAVCVSEKFADGGATHADLVRVHMAAQAIEGVGWLAFAASMPHADRAARAISQVGFYRVQRGRQLFGESRTAVKKTLCILIREVLGNPFRSSAPDAGLKSHTAITVAQGIYADGAFDRLPILADALEEAGCTDAEMLSHCRGPGPHVRGCWVVDRILGKE